MAFFYFNLFFVKIKSQIIIFIIFRNNSVIERELLKNNINTDQMKKALLVTLLLMVTLFLCKINAENTFKSVKLPPTYCYGTGVDSHVKIPAPELLHLKSANAESSVIFDVEYSGFSSSAINAFEYATSIYKLYFNSSVKIRIYASFESLGTNVLGSASPSGFYYDFDGSKPGVLYPVALAEKIAGKDLNDTSDYDIEIYISDETDIWYFGTDGNTPSGKYDFVSVMLHEMGHGLGFIGTMTVNSDGLGEWGYGTDQPTVFDLYIYNGDDEQIIDESNFTNPSSQLRSQLTSNDLFFHSNISMINNPEYGYPRLYAPVVFSSGSSIYHLNDLTYPAGNENSLMTHATGTAEAIHDPGPLAVNIYKEIGWSGVDMSHTPIKDTEDTITSVQFEITVKYDDAPSVPDVYLYYSTDNKVSFDSMLLNKVTGEDIYTSTYPVSGYDMNLDYYFKTYDLYNRKFIDPFDNSCYGFYIGTDTIKPVIEHIPPLYHSADVDTQQIEVTISDNIGIDSAYIKYMINQDVKPDILLVYDSIKEKYYGVFDFSETELQDFDSVKYVLYAVDKSKSGNLGVLPSDNQYFFFSVEPTSEILVEYQQNFDEYTTDFKGAYPSSLYGDVIFNISTPEGFNDGCLHTLNPYVSPEQDDAGYNYIAELRHKIILKNSAGMAFDEIVLVEPGEVGYNYGQDEFWDYVVVEGSNNNGKKWIYLEPGYDSRKDASWLSTYNSGYDLDNNSTGTGEPALYKNNYINLLANSTFEAGDTISIRFRLYSDPYVHGWGWAIDNLNIQGASEIKEISVQDFDLNIYPNPAISEINMTFYLPFDISNNEISILDLYGRKVFSEESNLVSGTNNISVNVSDLLPGIYFINLENKEFNVTRKILIQE